MDCSMSSFPAHHQLPELAQTHVHQVSDAIQPSHPLSSPLLLPSIFPNFRVFSNESVLHIRWPKYWSFSSSISSSNGYSGLISSEEEINTDFLLEEVTIVLPQSHQAGPQTAEQLYQRNYCTVRKVPGPTTYFPTWRYGKGIENPQRI